MEYRDWALSILDSPHLEDKLFTPLELTDKTPGTPFLFEEPTRAPHMKFHKRKKEEKLPSLQEHQNSDKRAICLHRFCNHELLAVEIMAQALLAFPQAPQSFRNGVAHTLKEEQEHVRLYMHRMKELGLNFGDLPLYRHFWVHVPYLTTPNHYLSLMSLTFEMANLDFAPIYGQSFLENGDEKSAQLMQRILHDEIKHVRFGYQMLKSLNFDFLQKNSEKKLWNIYEKSLSPFATAKRSKGFRFNEKSRVEAGIPEDWIEKVQSL